MYYTIKGRDRTENAAVFGQHQTLVFIAFQVFSRVFFVFLHCVQDRPASYIVARASKEEEEQSGQVESLEQHRSEVELKF